MIHNGTRPARHIYKERVYHEHFGGTAVADIPDFVIDTGARFDQLKLNAPYECVGMSTTKLLQGILKSPLCPDFSYAAARYIAGDGAEGVQGTSFHAGLQSAVAVGVLPESLAIISAAKNSEAYVSDWNNWLPSLRKSALGNVQNGILNVLGNGSAFNSILSAMYTSKIAVSIGLPWYDEFAMNTNGILPTPKSLNPILVGWHNAVITGKKTVNGQPVLIVESHQGDRVGIGGELYFDEFTINNIMGVTGTGALTIDLNSVRWIQLLGIILQRFPQALPLLPKLIQAHD